MFMQLPILMLVCDLIKALVADSLLLSYYLVYEASTILKIAVRRSHIDLPQNIILPVKKEVRLLVEQSLRRGESTKMERWAGKVAVVTGASVGIGAFIARELVCKGLQVVGLARRVEKIQEIAESLQDSPGKLHPVECDISKEESVIAAFTWIKDNLEPIAILINNAGIAKETSLTEGTLEDWRAVFDVNVFGLCLCTREAVRIMRESKTDAAIIHVNSIAGERVPAVPGFSVYPASKRAVAALAQTLRHELTGTQIRVMTISPGLVATDFMSTFSTFSKEALTAMPSLQPEDVAAAVIYALSTPPYVSVQDIILRPVGETW